MSSIGFCREMRAGFTRIIMLLFMLMVAGFAGAAVGPNYPVPTNGTAVVDGQTNEWNLTDDFFSDMYRAG